MPTVVQPLAIGPKIEPRSTHTSNKVVFPVTDLVRGKHIWLLLAADLLRLISHRELLLNPQVHLPVTK